MPAKDNKLWQRQKRRKQGAGLAGGLIPFEECEHTPWWDEQEADDIARHPKPEQGGGMNPEALAVLRARVLQSTGIRI